MMFNFFLREREISEEVKKTLKEAYDKMLERIKEAIENGKVVKDEYIEKVSSQALSHFDTND